MSGKDPELSRLGEALSSARSAYAAAKKTTDETKARLNETGSRIQTFNAKIADLKKGIDSEYNAMRSERAGGDRDAADEHRSLAQSLRRSSGTRFRKHGTVLTRDLSTSRPRTPRNRPSGKRSPAGSAVSRSVTTWSGSIFRISVRHVLTRTKRTGKTAPALSAARLSALTKAGSTFPRSAATAARS